MADLMPEEKDWLIKYCMESEENARLALRIGQVRMDLEKAIIRAFFERLSESVGASLKKCSLDSHWKPDEIRAYREDMGFPMTTQDQIELHLQFHRRDMDLRVGVPAGYKACPEADRVQPHFEDRSLKLLTSSGGWWRWWFYPKDDHRSLKDLATLRDEQVTDEKVGYFTHVLVDSARAISRALKE